MDGIKKCILSLKLKTVMKLMLQCKVHKRNILRVTVVKILTK